MSIATEISRIQAAKADLKTAIEGKGVTVPASALIDDYADYVDAISGGGGDVNPTAEDNDVNFIDYDGTIRYSYTKSDFANLSALPPNPTHSGLTSQGWNWTLSDAKTFVAQYGVLDIGQSYITDDGKSRFYVEVRGTDLFPTATICFDQNKANGVTVDWGDGSATETRSNTGRSTMSHDYASDGDYVITMEPTAQCTLRFQGAWNQNCMGGTTNFANAAHLKKVELGSNTSLNGGQAFKGTPIESITIPTACTDCGGDNIFQNCWRLPAIIIPNGATAAGGSGWAGATSVKRISLPKTITWLSSMHGIGTGLRSLVRFAYGGANGYLYLSFAEANSLRECILPSGSFIETALVNSAFANCVSLRKITIPDNYTALNGTPFGNCAGMREFHFLATTPPTLAANGLGTLNADCKIYVPSASLADYQAATNWSTYASYMVGE